MRLRSVGSLVLLGSHTFAQTPQAPANLHLKAQRLQLGTFRYANSSNGRIVGESKIRIQRSGQKYVFSNVVEGASDQRWTAVITPAFSPISADLTFGGPGGQHKAFALSYSTNHVAGVAATRLSGRFVDRRIAENIAGDTVDQRIDWAAVMAVKSYRPSQTFAFHVYDPKDGNSRIVATVKGRQTIHTRAGDFRVVRVLYRTEKTSGSQLFEVFIKEQAPRLLVKEVFPWGTTSELIETSHP